jgi:hypothetical protein
VSKHINYVAQCSCGWVSDPSATAAAMQKQVKQHMTDTVHKDYADVPLWGGALGTGTGPSALDEGDRP